MMVMVDEEQLGMNRYGRRAKAHYEEFLADELAKIPEDQRDSFFSTLGEQVAQEVERVEVALRGPDPKDEPMMERIGRFNMARMQAEELVRAELLPAPPDEPEVFEMMTDNDIILQYRLDPQNEDPERAAEDQMRLQDLRNQYREKGRYLEPS